MLSTWAAQGLALQQSPYQRLSASVPGPESGRVVNDGFRSSQGPSELSPGEHRSPIGAKGWPKSGNGGLSFERAL